MLDQKTCVPCQGGIPPLTKEEAEKFLGEIPNWRLVDDATKLVRGFDFPNFMDSLEFATKISHLAEEEGHHPDICFGWGYCNVSVYTHKIGGLHENDFILAAKIGQLYQS